MSLFLNNHTSSEGAWATTICCIFVYKQPPIRLDMKFYILHYLHTLLSQETDLFVCLIIYILDPTLTLPDLPNIFHPLLLKYHTSTINTQSQVLTTLGSKALKNIEKGKNGGNKPFSHFPTMFYYLSETNPIICLTLICIPAMDTNLDQSKIMSQGTELTK